MKTIRNRPDEDRINDILVYTYGTLGDLADKGLLTQGLYSLSDKGREHLAELKESGFQPTTEESKWAVAVILSYEQSCQQP